MTKDEIKIELEKKYPGAIEHVRALLDVLEPETGGREGLVDTPYRVVKSFLELYKGYDETPKDILSTCFTDGVKDKANGMVLCDHITFYSTCEHHMIPFSGVCHIGYIPSGKVVGLSKLVRLVHTYARRLQIQENLCSQIAEAIMEYLEPSGCGVVMVAKHLCTSARGVQNHTNHMSTSEMRGSFLDEPATRAEFLQLIELSGSINLSI